jgi:threonine synthase
MKTRLSSFFAQKCSKCGLEYAPELMVCGCKRCGGRVDILYDYDKVRQTTVKRDNTIGRIPLWLYDELLPIVDKTKRISLEEGGTPLLHCKALGARLDLERLYVKDETRNPSGSFKDRCSAISLSKAKESSVKVVVIASTGNAGASACAYSAKARIPCYVFVPASVDLGKLSQIVIYGGKVVRVDGTIDDCSSLAKAASEKYGWINVTTNTQTNPYSTQGSKTTAFEICLQLGWKAPDWFVVPFGGGGNLYGHWLGFMEFQTLNLIDSLPHLAAIQAAGCAPFVNAFKEQKTPQDVQIWRNAATIASGLRDPYPYDVELALPAIYKSGGVAEAVTDDEILEAEMMLASTEGIFAEPSAAASIAGLKRLVDSGIVKRKDLIVCEVTGSGLKDTESAMGLRGTETTKIKPSLQELERVLHTWS